MIKVLFVSSGNSSRGISPIVYNQGQSLQIIGQDLSYFLIEGKGIMGYLKNIISLKRYLNKNKFDIIHAHYGLCGIVSSLAKKNEKLIVSFMGEDLLGSYTARDKFTLLSKLIVWINKYFVKKYDYIIVKTNELAGIISKYKNVLIQPNGVDFNLFYPIEKEEARKQLHLNPNFKIIIFVSNPTRTEKNFKLAQKAFNIIKQPDFLLIPVFNKNQEELNQYYNAADVLILTSLHEGSPNVIKEAMACNCPIVATDVGDVKENISNTFGCYITSFDPLDIVKKIKLVLEFGKRTNGRQTIARLESGYVAKKIIDLYQKVIKEK